jgi:tRNA C32,U32 (ribose-2'-O)-methylase TrmJ
MQIPPPILVFVRPQAAGNLGALARVMSNFGCEDFRYVGAMPEVNPDQPSGFSVMDWAMARKGQSILESARSFPDLTAALEGVHLVIGSSGREQEFDRGYARPHVSPSDALRTVAEWQARAEQEQPEGGFRWAFVLGPEDDGISQQESALCQKLVRLPTVDTAPSMNVAMAAGCFLYQWHLTNIGVATLGNGEERGAFPPAAEKPRFTETGRGEWATHPHKERFLDYLMTTVQRTKFLKYPDVEGVAARLRRWLQAAPIPLGELLYAFEVVYHLRAWGTGHYESRDFLGRSGRGEESR